MASVPATPEYVLRVFADTHRQQCQFDPEAESGINLTFETTVAEWRLSCDLLGWRELAHSMNEWWKIQHTDEQWRGILEPARERHLQVVCEFIAATASMPMLPASRLLGATCHSATAFRAVRDALAAAGASIAQLRPSSPLDPFLRSYPQVFLNDISRLAPGALPPVKIRAPIYHAAVLGLILCFIPGCMALWLGAFSIALLCILLALACYVMTWIAARYIGPSRVRFGDLKTFRDLAQLIA